MNNRVTKQIINLKFKDNPKEITIDISQNIVFYGLNGHGKTRILKTIDLLIKLCKEKSVENSISIVKELNLEHLKINYVNYKDLFSLTEKIENEQNQIFKEQFNENKNLIELYVRSFSRYSQTLFDISDNFPPNLLKRLETLSAIKIDGTESPQFFKIYLQQTQDCLREIQRIIKFDKIDFDSIESEVGFLLSLNSNLEFSFLPEIGSHFRYNLKYEEELITRKDEIIEQLAIKNVIFISSEHPDLDKITKDIKKDYSEAKDILFSSIFEDDTNTGIKRAENIIRLIKSNKNKVNSIIKKYADIKLSINESGDLKFKKNESEIEYNKLSSGERRIIYIIMTIIFNEADIYLIDEPEISLSIDYQNKIVNDLYQLTRSKILMIATHAPFVYKDFQLLPNSTKIEI